MRRPSFALFLAIPLVAVGGGWVAHHWLSGHAPPIAAVKRSASWLGEPDFVLHVPHIAGSIVLDGDTDDPGWTGSPEPARTRELLLPNGAPARPFSEARLVWGDGYLYLCLYAADEDIESRTATADGPLWLDDDYRVVLSREGVDYSIEVSPRGTITDAVRRAGGAWDYPWSSGAHTSVERDGTLNHPQDMDEEWVVEMAIPFASIGLEGRPGETIGFAVSRCDTPKGAARVCASWGDGPTPGQIVLE